MNTEKEKDKKDEKRRVLLIACAGSHQIWALFLDNTIWWKYKTFQEGLFKDVLMTLHYFQLNLMLITANTNLFVVYKKTTYRTEGIKVLYGMADFAVGPIVKFFQFDELSNLSMYVNFPFHLQRIFTERMSDANKIAK